MPRTLTGPSGERHLHPMQFDKQFQPSLVAARHEVFLETEGERMKLSRHQALHDNQVVGREVLHVHEEIEEQRDEAD